MATYEQQRAVHQVVAGRVAGAIIARHEIEKELEALFPVNPMDLDDPNYETYVAVLKALSAGQERAYARIQQDALAEYGEEYRDVIYPPASWDEATSEARRQQQLAGR
jgi:hypothetical protein